MMRRNLYVHRRFVSIITIPLPRSIFGIVLAVVTVAACAAPDRTIIPAGTPEPDRYLFDAATEELDEANYLPARELFRRVVDGYPQSPYRFEAKLGLGDTYVGQGGQSALIQAINEFEEFLRFYPTNPRADYAQYMIGMAHYEQMRSPDRDQSHTRAAIQALETFIDTYPQSDLFDEGRANLRDAQDRFSESEFRVGRFYHRQRWYPGAVVRLRSVLEDDPEFTARDGVYFYLAEALVQLNRSAEALPYLERLVQEFEKSQYLADAQDRINELKGQGT